MPKVAHIIPDTNVFLQCKPLKELDWSLFSDYEELLLILTHPVVKEIDKHKNSGTKRLAKKARTANQLIGEIIDSTDNQIEIKPKSSDIILKIKYISARPTYEHESLDINENDDKIVSIAKAYSEAQANENVVLITNDNGLIFKAKAVNLDFIRTPETWKLPPEKDESEKEFERVKRELELLQQNYPKIVVEKKKREFKKDYYSRLKPSETESLMEKIRTHIPMATNFEQTEADKARASSIDVLIHRQRFKPATEEQIEEYKEKIFPRWLERCQEKLEKLHSELNKTIGFPTSSISMENIGGQPAKDVLVKLYPRGNFSIMGIGKSESENDDDSKVDLDLPTPPSPPRGVWHKLTIDPFSNNFVPNDLHRIYDRLPDFSPPETDCFYWDSKSMTEPGGYISLTCQSWRHGTGQESFSFYLMPDDFDAGMTGSITCEVHATNLASPIIEVIPVKVTLSRISCYDNASESVSKLIMQNG